jgi:5'-3' exonuclease
VTPDKDFAQLVRKTMTCGIGLWGKSEIERQVIDFLGMMGDAADNLDCQA